MKKTKQQIIEELRSNVEMLEVKNKKYEEILIKLKDELWGNRGWENKFIDIPGKVMEINARMQEWQGVRDLKVDMLIEENRRYWTLIRSLVGDKTLEMELEMNLKKSGINPEFYPGM